MLFLSIFAVLVHTSPHDKKQVSLVQQLFLRLRISLTYNFYIVFMIEFLSIYSVSSLLNLFLYFFSVASNQDIYIYTILGKSACIVTVLVMGLNLTFPPFL